LILSVFDIKLSLKPLKPLIPLHSKITIKKNKNEKSSIYHPDVCINSHVSGIPGSGVKSKNSERTCQKCAVGIYREAGGKQCSTGIKFRKRRNVLFLVKNECLLFKSVKASDFLPKADTKQVSCLFLTSGCPFEGIKAMIPLLYQTTIKKLK